MNGRTYHLSYAEIAFLSVELEEMLGNDPKMTGDTDLIEGLLTKLRKDFTICDSLTFQTGTQ